MKKINLLLLPLLALTMVGCTGKGSDSSLTSASDAPISQKTSVDKTSSNEKKTSSSKKTSSEGKTSSSEGGAAPVTSSSEEESASSSTVDVYASGWPTKVVDDMLEYLGGNVLPYINLGANKYVESSWAVGSSDCGVLTIFGDAEWDDTTSYNTLATLFAAAGWTTQSGSSNTKYIGKDSTGKLHVTIGARSTYSYSSDPTMVIQASYDEDYDLSAASAWDAETVQTITDSFGITLPYVYLGTKHPSASYNSYSGKLTVSGGVWNAQVLTDAATTLAAAGYTCTTAGDKLTATGKASATSQDTVTIVIYAYGYSLSKITMEVTVDEYFDPTSCSDWTSELKSQFSTNLDGHAIPYIYLGTKVPSYYWYSSMGELDIRGNGDMTTDQVTTVMNNSKTVFSEDDGWSVLEDHSTESYGYITYKKTYSDHHIIQCKIIKSSSYGVLLECFIIDELVVPSNATWSDTTKSLMTTNFGYILPYIYLNSTNETAVWNEASSQMVITGGSWTSDVLNHVNSVYSAEKDTDGNAIWTITPHTSYIEMEATIDSNEYSIEVSKSESLIKMTIDFVSPYVVPDDCTAWDAKVTTYFNNYMHGHAAPYVYLRSTDPEIYYSSYSKYLTLTGGKWDEGMITEAKKVYNEANGWTVTETAATTTTTGSITAVKDYGDGCKLTCLLHVASTYSMKAVLQVNYEEYYNANNTETEWTGAAASAIASLPTTVNIPYVYLGNNVTASYSAGSTSASYLHKLDLTGSVYSADMATAASTALTTAGYTVSTSTDSYGPVILAYNKDTTNNLLTLIYFHVYSSGYPMMTAYVSALAPITTSDTDAWDDTFTASVQSYISDTTYMLPYMSLGSNVRIASTLTDYAQIKSDDKLTHERSILIYDQLVSAGWTATLAMSGNDLKITAETKTPNKGKIKLDIDNYGTTTVKLYYYPPFVAPEGVTSWPTAVENLMTTNLGGHKLPYFYIGADSPQGEYYNYGKCVKIYGVTWDEDVYTNAIEAFNNEKDEDGNSYWSYMYDYSESTTHLWASRAFDDGTHMTVKIYKYVSGNSEKPLVEVYYR
jgi:hypothetical protein